MGYGPANGRTRKLHGRPGNLDGDCVVLVWQDILMGGGWIRVRLMVVGLVEFDVLPRVLSRVKSAIVSAVIE